MSILFTILVLLVAALLSVATALHLLATMLLKPARMTDGKALYVLKRMSPGDLDIPFETMLFNVQVTGGRPAIQIAGWWIDAPQASEKTVVLIHGYADAKVGALAWAPTWRELGYNCLLIDLRAHGESGGSICTGGVRERDDVDSVINQLVIQRPVQMRELVLFGVSLGGAVALATAARRNDLHGVVADSVFADYVAAAAAHGRLIGAPLPGLLPWAIRWAECRAGVKFADAQPLKSITACACPILLIHGEIDPFVSEDQVLALGKTLIERGNAMDDHWIVEEAGHVLGIAADVDAYRARLKAFLDRPHPNAALQR